MDATLRGRPHSSSCLPGTERGGVHGVATAVLRLHLHPLTPGVVHLGPHAVGQARPGLHTLVLAPTGFRPSEYPSPQEASLVSPGRACASVCFHLKFLYLEIF